MLGSRNRTLHRETIALMILMSVSHPARSEAQQKTLDTALDNAVRQAASALAPSVVRIDTSAGVEVSGQQTFGPTTGVIVGEDGWIITSSYGLSHRPAGIVVTLIPAVAGEPRRVPAKWIAQDHLRQLTLLKVDAKDLVVPQAAPLASIKQGQWSAALGRAWNAESLSISVGIVSALGRVSGKAIQTDAKVSPTNYGGPLIDLRGQVLGVIAPLSPTADKGSVGAELYDSGIGFAVPFEEVLTALPRLREGDLYPGEIGIQPANSNPMSGPVVVGKVRWRSPAANAGIAKGDVILSAGGKPVRRLADFQEALGRRYAGDALPMVVSRGEIARDVDLSLVEKLPVYVRPWLGILGKGTERPLGLEILRVFDGSPAADAKLIPGDVIIGSGNKPIRSGVDLEKIMDELPIGEPLVLDVRGKESRTVSVKTAAFPLGPLPGTTTSKVVVKKPPPLKEVPTAESAPAYRVQEPGGVEESEVLGALLYLVSQGGPGEEASMLRWRQLCDQNRLLFVALMPDAKGWSSHSLPRIEKGIAELRGRYALKDRAILIHGSTKTASVAWQYVRSKPGQIRGIVLDGPQGLNETESMEPGAKLAIYLIFRGLTPPTEALDEALEQIRGLHYPSEGHTEGAEPMDEQEFFGRLGGWIQSLGVL
ncbi:MAG: PDZ domain-containing protein [Planctomycetota bacterium]